MSENMKKFMEMVSKDENLKKKAMELNDMEPEKAVQAGIALAKENGIELTENDFAQEVSSGELSDDELDAVAGGRLDCPNGPNCRCVFSGFGDIVYRS